MISQERDHYRLSFILYNCFVFLWGGGFLTKTGKLILTANMTLLEPKKVSPNGRTIQLSINAYQMRPNKPYNFFDQKYL